MARARGPETRTMPTPPRPWAVAMAAMVSRDVDAWRSPDRRTARRPTRGVCVARLGRGRATRPWRPASIWRVMYHCWAIDRTLLTTQYSTRPAGTRGRTTVKTIGIIFIILACIGSGGVGLRSCWTNMVAPMMIGSTKYGSLIDRSMIQPSHGAWRISTAFQQGPVQARGTPASAPGSAGSRPAD